MSEITIYVYIQIPVYFSYVFAHLNLKEAGIILFILINTRELKECILCITVTVIICIIYNICIFWRGDEVKPCKTSDSVCLSQTYRKQSVVSGH